METIMWYLALIAGALCFLGGILYLFLHKNRSQSDYIKASAIELAAGWVLLLPYEYFEEITVDNPFLHIIESCLTALIRAINVFSAEGYEIVPVAGDETFTSIYTIVRVMVSILLALFTCGWVISFFEGPAQYLKLLLRSRSVTYIFSESNDKSVAIAKSIAGEGNKDINIIILEKNEEDLSNKIDLGSDNLIHLAMPLRKVIRILSRKTPKIEVYLFGENEEDNLSLLEEVFTEKAIRDCASIRFFVELGKTPWSLYDNFVPGKLGKGVENIVVNFVRTEENFIYNMLAENSIFANTVPEDGVHFENEECKRIHILIVGMNERNRDFLKAVLHLGQMPGYFLKITVFDKGEQMKELQNLLPSVRFNTRYCMDGDAYYSLFYYENVNAGSTEFEELIASACGDFTFAYINTGDDLENVSLGIRLGNLRKRNGAEDNYSIMVNLSKLDPEKWNSDRLGNICFSGSFDKIYSRPFITMSGIETATVEIHKLRQEEKKAAKEAKGKKYNIVSWDDYCNSEYNRHSVYARTLSFFYKMKIIDEYYNSDYMLTKSPEWMKYEHMRWDMYTRTIGYRDPDDAGRRVLEKMIAGIKEPSDKELRKVIKRFRAMTGVHEDLVPYEQLPEDVKNQDSLTLTKEIRDILGKVTDNEEGRSV